MDREGMSKGELKEMIETKGENIGKREISKNRRKNQNPGFNLNSIQARPVNR